MSCGPRDAHRSEGALQAGVIGRIEPWPNHAIVSVHMIAQSLWISEDPTLAVSSESILAVSSESILAVSSESMIGMRWTPDKVQALGLLDLHVSHYAPRQLLAQNLT